MNDFITVNHINERGQTVALQLPQRQTITKELLYRDSAEYYEAFINNQWQPEKLLTSDKGKTVTVYWTHPQLQSVADNVLWDSNWDKDIFGNFLPESERKIKVSVHTTMSALAEKPIISELGLYRLRCTNGMRALIGTANKYTFNVERATVSDMVTEFTDKIIDAEIISDSDDIFQQTALLPSGDINNHVAAKITRFVGDNFISEKRGQKPNLHNLPLELQNMFTSLSNVPQWYIKEVYEQLQMMQNGDFNIRGISSLDVLNAITTPINNNPDRQTGYLDLNSRAIANTIITPIQILGAFS